MIFKKDVFNKIGFFDPKLGRMKGKLYSSDEDQVIRRVRSCCHYLFLPDAEVMHIVPSKRMTLSYLINWSYYAGKSKRVLDGRNTIRTTYDIIMTVKNMLNPFIVLNKSARIKQIANLIFNLGRLV